MSPAAATPPALEDRYTLTKSERIRRRSEFKALFESGKRVHSEYLTVIHCRNTTGVRRLGLVVGKRVGKTAVRRNRMKRLLREFFRLNKHRLPASQDILIVARKDFSFMKGQDLCRELEKVLAGQMKA
ncbi:MAG: ribonuclease P protein component [Syntrophaceae bacterium]|nr:ribonuclease P protein component [Syntrophaceae bacterium]